MGRKSQLEKFDAKWGKAAKDKEVISEERARKIVEESDYMTKGEQLMKEASNGTEEVFAVIARSGMETFVKTWNNSMESVVRETIRTEVKTMVQEEMQSAMKGMFAGMNEAMTEMVQQGMNKQVEEEVSEEPVEFDMTKVTPIDELINRHKEKDAPIARNPHIHKGEVESICTIPRTDSGRIQWRHIREAGKEAEVIQQIVSRVIANNPYAQIYSVKGIKKEGNSDLTGAYQYFNRKRKEFGCTWKEFVEPLI